MSLNSLYDTIHEDALPGVWSKGVSLAREKAVIIDSQTPSELVLRVKTPGKAVNAKVSLWPEDDDAHCDCGDRVEPCMHLIAAVVAVKNAWAQAAEGAGTASTARLAYRFTTRDGALVFSRLVVLRGGQERPLETSLVSYLGGIESGRIAEAPLPATREDFKVDQVLAQLESQRLLTRGGGLEQRTIPSLFNVLKELATVELDGEKVTIDSRPMKRRAALEDSPAGVRLIIEAAGPDGAREYSNGAILLNGVLRPLTALSASIAKAAGHEFRDHELAELATQLLPLLQKETELSIRSRKIPRIEKVAPRIIIETHTDRARPEDLEVMAKLVYGSPPIAEVFDGRLELLDRHVIPERDEPLEQTLLRELQLELHLKPRQRVRLSGSDAVNFLRRSEHWERHTPSQVAKAFSVHGELTPGVAASTAGLRLSFSVDGKGAVQADAARVLAAWRAGESLVSLRDQAGWAALPAEWLREHADRLERFLALKNPSPLEQFQLAEFCAEAGGELSQDLAALREKLAGYRGIPEQPLPPDLRATLRPYQKLGVNWLGFLREAGLGAMLADDMGLGKTLQALCAVRGRTLIIAPTSVLPPWENQIRGFRPGLRLNVYYGASRRLDPNADVILTSYGILRQDRALFTAESWDTIVLDEAQQIKNPDSQLAKITHELRGTFKIALTGTPIENRLSDLWSQFQFIQPGLLGSRDEFQAGVTPAQLAELRRRIKPLILRRMKREVAPELPPKTETTLYSELTENEQLAYQTVLAATQESVLRELEAGGSVLGALEALLRLRQLCAHPALVPGLTTAREFAPSSKLELLQETLEESLELGHSVLIFSQWTSFLDLVEKVLHGMKVEFLRLDGSTRNRSEVIDRFQDPAGPRVMILSLKAGGVGVTLTKADHVIILDPWWNPAVEDQAADRAHRIGQLNPVLVQRLVARGTVEDRILELQKKKQELARAVLGAGGAGDALELTREDLLELLRP